MRKENSKVWCLCLLLFGLALTGCSVAGDETVNNYTGNINNGNNGSHYEPGQLTAGEWSDLENWEFWLGLLDGEYGSHAETWQMNTLNLFFVRVEDGVGLPVVDAQVELVDSGERVLWEARTDNRGRAALFAAPFGGTPEGPFSLVASAGEARALVTPQAFFTGEPEVIVLDDAPSPETILDLMFMVDTTGSMCDELDYLKAELADVIAAGLDEAGSQVTIRLSVNFYRDEGDAYVVRAFPFTTDIASALEDLQAQACDGGGDFPEAVVEAMESVVDEHDWSPSARARLCFLVLDAPPHYSAAHLERLQTSVAEAAALGVRVIPVSASGIDQHTEFLLRFVDVLTGGTYVFITDASGIGGDHLEPTIGEYEVELLNALLQRLIVEAIEAVPAT